MDTRHQHMNFADVIQYFVDLKDFWPEDMEFRYVWPVYVEPHDVTSHQAAVHRGAEMTQVAVVIQSSQDAVNLYNVIAVGPLDRMPSFVTYCAGLAARDR